MTLVERFLLSTQHVAFEGFYSMFAIGRKQLKLAFIITALALDVRDLSLGLGGN